jgi:hypothetical protein
MQVLEQAVAESANPWPLRRERAAELVARYPHAAEMLRLYLALNPVQETAYLDARTASLQLEDLPQFAVDRVMPSVIDVTVASGPARLRDGVIEVFCSTDLAGIVRRWLEEEPLSPFERYMARASASPVLEGISLLRSSRVDEERSDRLCPSCGGLPQLSYFAVSGEALVTGPRYLLCSRCANSWAFSRMTCASCGESTGARLPIFQEQEQFPHVRVDGCKSCKRYLLTFDLRRDARAVPVVDELAALPLDLYAIDQGLTKITPNLMGN